MDFKIVLDKLNSIGYFHNDYEELIEDSKKEDLVITVHHLGDDFSKNYFDLEVNSGEVVGFHYHNENDIYNYNHYRGMKLTYEELPLYLDNLLLFIKSPSNYFNIIVNDLMKFNNYMVNVVRPFLLQYDFNEIGGYDFFSKNTEDINFTNTFQHPNDCCSLRFTYDVIKMEYQINGEKIKHFDEVELEEIVKEFMKYNGQIKISYDYLFDDDINHTIESYAHIHTYLSNKKLNLNDNFDEKLIPKKYK